MCLACAFDDPFYNSMLEPCRIDMEEEMERKKKEEEERHAR